MNKEFKYNTIILDADETLFDFKRSEREAIKAVMEKYNFPWTEEVGKIYSEENKKLWTQLEKGSITREKLKIQRFINFFDILGIQLSANEIADFCNQYIYHLGDKGYLLSGAEALCKQLAQGATLYIATNGLKATQTRRFASSPIMKYIEKIYISEEIGYQKPQAEFFDYIFNEADVTDKSRVIVLGDSLTSDMQGGKNAGITTCLFNPLNAKVERKELCDYIITNLNDFAKIVK